MGLQYKFFTIPLHEAEELEVELNRFLRSVRVVQVQRQFVDQGEYSRWALLVEYMSDTVPAETGSGEGKKKSVDYKQVLSFEDFEIFVRLREWRKFKAAEEGVPVYIIFTNEQLAKIIVNRVGTQAGLAEIEGVGKARISKYGEEILREFQAACVDREQEDGA